MPRVSQVRLSATLIVRNEAAHLRRCLASIRTFTDEIIVVDTGSTDNSPAVAAEFGARLFALDWQGDFSAARNHALAHASGDWILYIDADECARPLNADALRVALADPGLVAATVAFRSRTGMTRYRECRLFRNDPRIRFRNVIHETMMNDVHAVAQSDGLGIGRSPLALDHFGYDGDQSAKHRRNIPLLRARLARDPGHVYSWNHLGQALMGVGDVRAAVEAWQRAIDTVRGRGVQGALDALPYGSLLLFGGEQVAPGLLDEARARFPADLLLQWLQGQQLADAGRFNALRTTTGSSASRRGTRWRSATSDWATTPTVPATTRAPQRPIPRTPPTSRSSGSPRREPGRSPNGREREPGFGHRGLPRVLSRCDQARRRPEARGRAGPR